MGGGSGGGSSSSTTSMPAWQQPYVKDMMTQAQGLSKAPLQYYPGETVAQFNPTQVEAQNKALATANAGSPLMTSTSRNLQDTMSGMYLNPDTNPYLKQTYETALRDSQPQWDSTAVNSGRYGGGQWAIGRGELESNLANQVYGGNYQAERGRQLQAAQMAPSIDDYSRYGDIAKMAAVGAEQQGMDQALINAAREKFDFGQNEAWNRLMNYRNAVTGGFGGTVTSNQSGGGK